MIYAYSSEFATNCGTRFTVSNPFTRRKYARKGRTMIIPNEDKGLGKRRHAMPQLTDFTAFKKDLDDNDIALVDIRIPADELTPTQGNFNEEKVEFLRKQKNKGKPIITSNDDYVIDGHHRWLAAAQDHGEVDCRVVDMTAEELFRDLATRLPARETRYHLVRVQRMKAQYASPAGARSAMFINR